MYAIKDKLDHFWRKDLKNYTDFLQEGQIRIRYNDSGFVFDLAKKYGIRIQNTEATNYNCFLLSTFSCFFKNPKQYCLLALGLNCVIG
jgi:hypothetical protein